MTPEEALQTLGCIRVQDVAADQRLVTATQDLRVRAARRLDSVIAAIGLTERRAQELRVAIRLLVVAESLGAMAHAGAVHTVLAPQQDGAPQCH